MIKLPKRIRWRIANLLDRLPGQCWSDLVEWALGYRTGSPWSPRREMCRYDAAQRDGCYCGKFRAPAGGEEVRRA